MQAFRPVTDEATKQKVLQKLETARIEQGDEAGSTAKPNEAAQKLEATLTEDEIGILNTIRAREMLRIDDSLNTDNLAADVIDGRRINLVHGDLGLVKPTGLEKRKEQVDSMAMMLHDEEKAKAAERPAAVIAEPPAVAAH